MLFCIMTPQKNFIIHGRHAENSHLTHVSSYLCMHFFMALKLFVLIISGCLYQVIKCCHVYVAFRISALKLLTNPSKIFFQVSKRRTELKRIIKHLEGSEKHLVIPKCL